MKDVIIFGSGKIGKSIYQKIEQYFNILCFLDNNSVQYIKIEHLNVEPPENIINFKFDLIIIASEKYKEEIREQLTETINIQDDKIIYFNDLESILNLIQKIIELASIKDKGIIQKVFNEIFNIQYNNLIQQRNAMRRVSLLLEKVLEDSTLTIDLLQTSYIGGQALEAINRLSVYKEGFMNNLNKEKVINYSTTSANETLTKLLSKELPIINDKTFPATLKYSKYNWETGIFCISKNIYNDFFYRNGDLFKTIVKFQDSNYANKYTNKEYSLELPLKEPHLKFFNNDLKLGEDFLSNVIGMKEDDWFVAIYARDGAYYGEDINSKNWFRNADINAYLLAIDEIVKRGGYVIRIGGDVSTLLDYNHPKVFDYSSSEYQNDFLDIFLLANCKFLIGTPSGYTHVAIPFKIPQLLINCINCFAGFCELWIPKKIKDTQTNELISFIEFLDRYHSHNNIGEIAENGINQKKFLNIEYIDNTPEEIKDATIEMFDLLDHKQKPSKIGLDSFYFIWEKWSKPYIDIPIAHSFVKKYYNLFKEEI